MPHENKTIMAKRVWKCAWPYLLFLLILDDVCWWLHP